MKEGTLENRKKNHLSKYLGKYEKNLPKVAPHNGFREKM